MSGKLRAIVSVVSHIVTVVYGATAFVTIAFMVVIFVRLRGEGETIKAKAAIATFFIFLGLSTAFMVLHWVLAFIVRRMKRAAGKKSQKRPATKP